MEEKSNLKPKLIAILVAVILLCCSCFSLSSFLFIRSYVGNGNVVTDTVEAGEFTEITLNGNLELILVQGPTQNVEVRAEENMIGFLKSENKNGNLNLVLEKPGLFGVIYPREPIKIIVTSPDLKKITTYGSNKIIGEKIKMERLSLTINGTGQVDLNIFLDDLDAYIQGSANFNLTGIVDDQNIVVNGSGNYESRDLKTERTFITINGSGNAIVNATRTLEAQINGSGRIQYTGGAQVTPVVNGTGTITQL